MNFWDHHWCAKRRICSKPSAENFGRMEGAMCIGPLDMTNIPIDKSDSEGVFHLARLGMS